jgi:hypothetical protein
MAVKHIKTSATFASQFITLPHSFADYAVAIDLSSRVGCHVVFGATGVVTAV